jgi:hypothetical protein
VALTKSGGDTTLLRGFFHCLESEISQQRNGSMIAVSKDLDNCNDYFDLALYDYEEEVISDGPKLSCVQMQQLLAQFRQGVSEVVEGDTIASNIIDKVVIPMAVNNFLGTVDHYDDVNSAIDSLNYELRAAKKWGNNQLCD